MAIDLPLNLPIEEINTAWLSEQGVRLRVLRLDKVHPVISGNKWFKLKENIRSAKEHNKTTLLTYGGAFSNHLIATAAAAQQLGFHSIGFVRGFHGNPQSNATLMSCKNYGMDLKFLSREDYREKNDEMKFEKLKQEFPFAWIIPEGGNNAQGRKGVEGILNFLPKDADVIALPVGSGATFTGLRKVIPSSKKMIGFAGFKNGDDLRADIQSQLHSSCQNWELITNYHFGGFAKHSPKLIQFLNYFYGEFNIPLDFIYTGKMMFGLFHQIKKQAFPKNSSLIAIHTGGLQGNSSLALHYS